MTWRQLFSPCLFVGHPGDPLIVVVRGKRHHECRRCGENLGEVLKGQRLKLRKPGKVLRPAAFTRKQA